MAILFPNIEHHIQVSYPHRVLFTEDVFHPDNSLLQEILTSGDDPFPRRVMLVLDESLVLSLPRLIARLEAYFEAYSPQLSLVCTPLLMEGGELGKNSWHQVAEIHAQIDRHHIDRHSYLIAVGGGALLDMAGLAAATAHRGIRHIRIPTTTLSQCDSGVGVKNGINAFGKKNFIGTFSPPFAVINDFRWLDTLSARDKRGGYAEAVKVALIRDAVFFNELEANAEPLRQLNPDAMRQLIFRCAQLHTEHIATSGDPFELGTARPLDFGHWAAHKLEQLSEFRLRHGEAVAIGMALDVIYSRQMGFLAAPVQERILGLLEQLGFNLFAPELLLADENRPETLKILSGLKEFQEHLGGALSITMIRGIGQAFEVHEMDEAQVKEAILELQARLEQKQGKT